MTHCDICKASTISWSPYACKPEDGGMWRMNKTCVDEVHGNQHTMQMNWADYPTIKGHSK